MPRQRANSPSWIAPTAPRCGPSRACRSTSGSRTPSRETPPATAWAKSGILPSTDPDLRTDASVTDFLDEIEGCVPALRRYARALTRNADRADDLVQDCLERALRKRLLWRPTGPLRAWLYRI